MNYYHKDFDIFTSKTPGNRDGPLTKGSKVLYIPDTLAKEDAGFCSSNRFLSTFPYFKHLSPPLH